MSLAASSESAGWMMMQGVSSWLSLQRNGLHLLTLSRFSMLFIFAIDYKNMPIKAVNFLTFIQDFVERWDSLNGKIVRVVDGKAYSIKYIRNESLNSPFLSNKYRKCIAS